MAPVSFFKVDSLPAQLVADAIYFVRKSPSVFEIVVTNSQAVALSQEPAQNGIDGANGLSAYQLAQSVGYAGSLEAWLASLKGEDGEPGVNGVNAKQGYAVRPVSGRYISQSHPSIPHANTGIVANRLLVSFFAFDRDIDVTEAGFVVNGTSAAGGTGTIVVYEVSEDLTSAQQVFISAPLGVDTTGDKVAAFQYTFRAGVIYAAGVLCGYSGFTTRTVQPYAGWLSMGHSARNQSGTSSVVYIPTDTPLVIDDIFANPANDRAAAVLFTVR